MNAFDQVTDAELSAKVDEAVRRRNNAPTPAAEQAAREEVKQLREEIDLRCAKKMGI